MGCRQLGLLRRTSDASTAFKRVACDESCASSPHTFLAYRMPPCCSGLGSGRTECNCSSNSSSSSAKSPEPLMTMYSANRPLPQARYIQHWTGNQYVRVRGCPRQTEGRVDQKAAETSIVHQRIDRQFGRPREGPCTLEGKSSR